MLEHIKAHLWIYIIACVVIGIILGLLSDDLQTKKGYDKNPGFILGFFLGIIGLIYSAGLPINKKEKNKEISAPIKPKNNEYKFCKKCGFPVYSDETKCSNCNTPIKKD